MEKPTSKCQSLGHPSKVVPRKQTPLSCVTLPSFQRRHTYKKTDAACQKCSSEKNSFNRYLRCGITSLARSKNSNTAKPEALSKTHCASMDNTELAEALYVPNVMGLQGPCSSDTIGACSLVYCNKISESTITESVKKIKRRILSTALYKTAPILTNLRTNKHSTCIFKTKAKFNEVSSSTSHIPSSLNTSTPMLANENTKLDVLVVLPDYFNTQNADDLKEGEKIFQIRKPKNYNSIRNDYLLAQKPRQDMVDSYKFKTRSDELEIANPLPSRILNYPADNIRVYGRNFNFEVAKGTRVWIDISQPLNIEELIKKAEMERKEEKKQAIVRPPVLTRKEAKTSIK